MLRITLVSILLMVSVVAASFGQQNSAPEISETATAEYTIAEGTGTTTVGGSYSATDADDDAFVWKVTGTGFSISEAGVLTFTVTDPDFETTLTYAGIITATDIHGEPSADFVVTVNILNLEEPGEISFNQSVAGQITATLSDPDGVPDTVRWSWSGIAGTDPGTATYETVAGDAGKTLTVTAQYADPAGGSDSLTDSVTVGATANPVFSPAVAAVTVNEDTSTPHTVGTYTATGGTPPLKYSVAGDGFAINSNSGVLTLTVTDGFDYETTPSYSVTNHCDR